MDIPKIKNAHAFDAHTLIITFINGKRKKYDVTRLLNREMFAIALSRIDPGLLR